MFRRDFLTRSGVAAITLTQRPRQGGSEVFETIPPRAPTAAEIDYKSMTARALDVARGAGAQYADVRITYIRDRSFLNLFEQEELGIGIRALVNGCWGFASTPYLTPDLIDRTAREAVAQAKVNGIGGRSGIELTAIPTVSDGRWSTPVRIDPFDVPVEEVRDWATGISTYILRDLAHEFPNASLGTAWHVLNARKTEKILGSSEGTYIHQTFVSTEAEFRVSYNAMDVSVDCFPSSVGGWDLVVHAPIVEASHRAAERLARAFSLPQKAVEVGRRQVVLDAGSVAGLLSETIGAATQIDRALGYEANAGGTSYLGPDPFHFLGTAVGAPSLTVTANRSHPSGLASTHWDDEGAVPDEFPLITNGVLVDYQTTREQAGWLAPWYQKQGVPVHSHGCAASTSALALTVQHTPNLAMAPGDEAVGFEELIAGVPTGLAFVSTHVSADFQHGTGLGIPAEVYEIRNGRRVARVRGAGVRFRAMDLWKNLIALGGASALDWGFRGRSTKGEPAQALAFSVGAVPAVIKDMAIVDAFRKA